MTVSTDEVLVNEVALTLSASKDLYNSSLESLYVGLIHKTVTYNIDLIIEIYTYINIIYLHIHIIKQ